MAVGEDRFVVAGGGLRTAPSCLFFAILLGCVGQVRAAEGPAEVRSNLPPHTVQTVVTADSAHGRAPILTNQGSPPPQDLRAARHSRVGQTDLLSIWRSPKSTSEERVDAVMKLVPRGASLEAAQALLGDKGTLSRSHGPSINFAPGTNGSITGQTGSHDFWELEYQTPSGIVALRFELKPGGQKPQFRFDRAYSVRVLKGSSGN